MELVAILALAGSVGWLLTFIQSRLAPLIPQNKFLQSTAGQAVVNGLLVLLAFVAATFVIRKLKLSKHLPAAVK